MFEDPLNRLLTLATVLMAVGMFALHRYRARHGHPPCSALGAVFQIARRRLRVDDRNHEAARPDAGARHLVARRPGSSSSACSFRTGRSWTLLARAGRRPRCGPPRIFFNCPRFDLDAAAAGITSRSGRASTTCWRSRLRRRPPDCTAPRSRPQRAVELGSYRLVAPIGEGGMGEVWQASHQMLARKAAIKLVRPEGLTARQAEVAAKRFQREANVIAGLQSPHTVYLYDFGVRAGRPLLLRDGAARRHQPADARHDVRPAAGRPRGCTIMRQICESLEEAHQHGTGAPRPQAVERHDLQGRARATTS